MWYFVYYIDILINNHNKVLYNFPKATNSISKHFLKFSKISKDNPRLKYVYKLKYVLRFKHDVINIFNSEDMENMPTEFQMWFPMYFTTGKFSSKTLVSI